MTVKEFIEELQKLDLDLEVMHSDYEEGSEEARIIINDDFHYNYRKDRFSRNVWDVKTVVEIIK